MEPMVGGLKKRDEKSYKRVVQLTSKMLRGSEDTTGGAIELAPRRSKIDKSLNLVKSHATKNYNFYKPALSTSKGRMSNVQKTVV
jgi:hypothetical protein